MPELDTLTIVQLIGIAATFSLAIGVGVWRIKRTTGTDRDILLLFGSVGACVFLTLVQFIALMIRLG
ncbi:hypothetical protein OT109_10040 [Phycisphaeraceae bacterium D3-23]